MPDKPKEWLFGLPPYHKSCGSCGWEYLAKTIDAGVPQHECKKQEPRDAFEWWKKALGW